jgi:Putative peptidoglycan binding domain
MDKKACHFIVTMMTEFSVMGAMLLLVGSAALAQTTAAIDPNHAAAPSSGSDDVPPGGCMPIGVSASGEIIFPFLCKGFLERHGGIVGQPKPAAAEEQKPAAAEGQKPAAPEEQKPAEKQAEGAAPSTATRNLTTGVDSATFTEEASQLTEDQLSLDRSQRRDVQQRLTDLGFKTKVTGKFAQKTRAMIKRWQAGRGYPATGYLNELQHKALLSKIAATLQ